MFKECKDIVIKLLNLKAAVWFRKPVDVVSLKIPNYHLFVKTPMDLGTIRTKLSSNQYSSVLEFRDDVELVWSNCFAYNGEGSEPRAHGEHCKKVWDGLWRNSGLEERWRQLQFDEDPTVRACMQGHEQRA